MEVLPRLFQTKFNGGLQEETLFIGNAQELPSSVGALLHEAKPVSCTCWLRVLCMDLPCTCRATTWAGTEWRKANQGWRLAMSSMYVPFQTEGKRE